MKLSEFITITGLELDVRWTEGLGIFQVDFHHTEVKQGIMLAGWWGGGKTREAAIKEYCSRIEGETLVVHARNAAKRQEIDVPDTLTYTPTEDNFSTEFSKVNAEEPEIEIREMEITANMSNCLCMYNDEGQSFGSIANVHERPDFIGFKCDGWIWGRVYKNKKSGDMFIKIPANQLDDYEVCDMAQAHVLFQRPK